MILRSARLLVRLRCDVDGCARIFTPRPPVWDLSTNAAERDAAAAAVREAAQRRGWEHAAGGDACPACLRHLANL